MFSFRVTATHERARTGQLCTPHGSCLTPAFVFCATKGAIKGVSAPDMAQLGTQIMLNNTYHLHVYPGAKRIQALGGMHKMMHWTGPLLSDSGGFQIFSLGYGGVAQEIKGQQQERNHSRLKITEEGAWFRSYRTGERLLLTPETSIDIQHALGTDIMMPLDECTPFHKSYQYTKTSMERSHRWEERSLTHHTRSAAQDTQKLYGIVQGGVYEDLRQESVQFVKSHPFWGYAIGGSLGQTREQMHHIVSLTAAKLVTQKPIHLLGIGGIQDIFHGVKQGIDTFDCVHPTRLARHGGALIRPHYWDTAQEPYHMREHITLTRSTFARDLAPIDAACGCATCQTYSRGYIHMLLRSQELEGILALTRHNVYFMNQCMKDIRQGILTQTLDQIQKTWCPRPRVC